VKLLGWGDAAEARKLIAEADRAGEGESVSRHRHGPCCRAGRQSRHPRASPARKAFLEKAEGRSRTGWASSGSSASGFYAGLHRGRSYRGDDVIVAPGGRERGLDMWSSASGAGFELAPSFTAKSKAPRRARYGHRAAPQGRRRPLFLEPYEARERIVQGLLRPCRPSDRAGGDVQKGEARQVNAASAHLDSGLSPRR
jgi:hypothetical protein